MRTLALRACASTLLAATLLPVSVFAQPTERSPDTSSPPPDAPSLQQEAAPSTPPPELESAPAPKKSLWRYSDKVGSTQLDFGASLGFNSPSGIYGAELEYRILPNLGLNVSGGSGMWGVRVGPHVRFYPLGEVPLSPFLEAGTSFNFGGGTWVEVDGVRRDGDMLFTPVATLAVGSRLSLGRLFFVSSRVGWGWRLRQDNFQMRDGQSPDVLTDTAISLIQHGGFLFSGTLGVSFF